jgi:putative Tad-like protein involved in Flp pilus assembly
MAMTAKQRERRSERGVALAFAVLGLLAFMPIAVVAVDIGRLAFTATEVQNEADIAAAAGAQTLLQGGSAATARSNAQTVVAQNKVAGAAATMATSDLLVGQYNPATNAFTNGATPANAVRATARVTVQNLLAGYFGSSFQNATVVKSATAGFSGTGQATPTLPLAIGACNFQALESCFATPGCLPALTQAPSGSDNSGWIKTGNYLPTSCGGSPTVMSGGASIPLSNGQATSTLKSVSDCFKTGVREYVVAIVDGACDNAFNKSRTVTGFATVVVTAVKTTGSKKGIALGAIFKQVAGPPGGGAFGSGSIRLFN